MRPEETTPADLEERLAEFQRLREADPSLAFESWLGDQPAGLRADLRRAWEDLQSFDRRPQGFFLSQHRARRGSSSRARPGLVLDDYRLVRLLGHGGMGEVWEAHQASLARPVALKLVWGEDLDEAALQRFQAEARAAARIRHPGVIAVQAIGAAEGFHYIAEELVEEGWTLKDFLDEVRREGVLPEDYYRHVARLFAEVAEALQAAHEAGVIHRDVKPSNLLITPQDRPKVADFGLARLTETRDLSRTGDFVGTYGYMSPEQAMARRIGLDHRTDVFSLGATLYEALTLRRAFEGDTSAQVLENVLYQDPPDPRALRPQVPRDLAVICAKALEKQRTHRYATMKALAEDLLRFLAGESILARPMGVGRKAVRWVRLNRKKSLAAAAFAGAVLAALIVNDYLDERRRTQRLADYANLTSVLEELRKTPRHEESHAHALEDLLDRGRELLEREAEHRVFRDSLRSPKSSGHVLAAEATSGLAKATDPSETADRWQLEQVEAHLQRIEQAKIEFDGLDARIEPLRKIGEQTLSNPGARRVWQEAREAIGDPEACPLYGGLSIEPQSGLLPLGRDPESGLWEFLHVLSGTAPTRNPATGRWQVEAETGIVFVLLPGGKFTIGSKDDPDADSDETPQEIELAPFFLSKYELTQAQWLWLAGSNPSKYDHEADEDPDPDLTNPLEHVSWTECHSVLGLHGLCLPSEARWEYGARAGTTTPWSTGATRETLNGAANLADKSGLGYYEASSDWPDLVDGFSVHAPVDALRPNAFGLHHVHGNVAEWTLDRYCDAYASYPLVDSVTGERQVPMGQRVVRGGGFDSRAAHVRSARREFQPEDYRKYSIGVRPARNLEGAWRR